MLAWAEYPRFNPNAYKKYNPASWRNRMAMDPIEPGSVIKPLLVAAALQEKVVEPDTIFYCEKGRMRLDRKLIRDVSAKDWLPVRKIVLYSSNIGAAKIAMALGAEKYYNYLAQLGFGTSVLACLWPVKAAAFCVLLETGNVSIWPLRVSDKAFPSPCRSWPRGSCCLANGGVLKPLRLVLDPYVPVQAETRVFEPAVAREGLAHDAQRCG